jgi:Ca2+-binding RTX toxin-like protein
MPTPTFSGPSFRLNTGLNSAQDSVAVAGLSDGRFVSVWRDLAGGSLGTLKYAIYNADGTVAKAEAIANQNTTGRIDAGDLAIAALTGGGFAITWSSRLNNQNDIFHRVFNKSGAPVSEDLTSNLGVTAGDQRSPDIASDGAGGFHVVWEDGAIDFDPGPGVSFSTGVQLRSFAATGQPAGSIAMLSDTWGGDHTAAIATNRIGSQFAVVWEDSLGQSQQTNGDDSIRGFLSGVGEFRIDSGNFSEFHDDPDVAYSTGNNFMAVWSEFISLGVYQVNGAINGGGEFKVNTSAHVHSGTIPSVVGLQSGNFLVVWSDGGLNGGFDVLGQLFSVNGAKIGSEFVVSDFSSSTIARIEASELLDGRVLVTWDPNKLNQTVGPDAFARIVDPRQVASNFLGTAAHEQYVGTRFVDVLNGAAGNDRLWGEAGADRMTGGRGNDILYVDNPGDRTFEFNGQGSDTVLTTVSFALTAGQHIETFRTTAVAGTTAINLTGNALAQRIEGNNGANRITGNGGNDSLYGHSGNDTLTGGPGQDRLIGGLGNDIYVLENGADTVSDAGGLDTISSTVSRSLVPYAAVENLMLVNVSTALNGTGNNLNNTLTGNNFHNSLSGALGNDVLRGGLGNDVLRGGRGNDVLDGAAGNDSFVFDTPLNATTNRDTITAFGNAVGNNDRFQLDNAIFAKLGTTGGLNAAFFKLTTQVQDADDYIRYNPTTGGLFYDANGSAAGAGIQFATLSTKPLLTAADFVVI